MIKTSKKKQLITIAAIIIFYAAILVFELTQPGTHTVFAVLKKAAIYSLAAVSMNLLNGFTGLFSLGQAGFMLIGAYAYAICTMPMEVKLDDSVYRYYDCAVGFEVGMIPGLLIAGVLAALFAALIGLPVLRLKSDYLAIATLGFAEIIRAFIQWDKLGPITNSANTLKSYPSMNDAKIPFTDIAIPPTFLLFLISGVCILVIVLLINSSYGRALKAVRDDEIAAEAMGINLFKHKELSFVISSFFAGVSGALLAMFQYTVAAQQFKTAMTYEILLIVVIGGIGSVSGSCIGSFLFIACNEWWLRFLDEAKNNLPGMNILRPGFRSVVFSLVIMIIVLFFSKGLMGDKELPFNIKRMIHFFKTLPERIRKKRAAKQGKGGAE